MMGELRVNTALTFLKITRLVLYAHITGSSHVASRATGIVFNALQVLAKYGRALPNNRQPKPKKLNWGQKLVYYGLSAILQISRCLVKVDKERGLILLILIVV
jgi:hypothetical protein